MQGVAGSVAVRGESLAGVGAFRSLSVEERAAIARRCHGHRVPAGREILPHNDRSSDVFFIVSGRVRVTICSRDGKEVTYRDLDAGQLFGDLSAIDGQPRSARVVASTDSLVASLSAKEFWRVLNAHPAVTAVILKELVKLIRFLSERVFEFSTFPVPKRVHAEVLRLARQGTVTGNSATIEGPPTHAVLASRIGTHREAVTRELNRLESEGLIERRSGTLTVRDVDALARRVEQDPG